MPIQAAATRAQVPVAAAPRPGARAVGLLALQRAAGNRAVTMFVQREAGPPLVSPRFKQDERLQACRADKARLGPGGPAKSTERVQQALIDRGLDLGPTGADGIYGTKTSQAVRTFKAVEGLGSTSFGDVGPGTMGRLDELFPPDVVNTDESEENVGDDGSRRQGGGGTDLLALAEADAAESEAGDAGPANGTLGFAVDGDAAGDQTGDAGGGQTVGAGAHISMTQAVERFRGAVDVVDPSVSPEGAVMQSSSRGQFFWSSTLVTELQREIERLKSEPSAIAAADAALAFLVAVFKGEPTGPLLTSAVRLALANKGPEAAALRALVRPSPADGATMYTSLQQALDRDPSNQLPAGLLLQFRTIQVWPVLRSFSKVACGTAALNSAARFRRRSGVVPDPAAPRVGARLATGAAFRDRRPTGFPASTSEPAATSAVTPGSTHHLGDVIAQSGVAAAAAAARGALDGGRLIHARVLSGQGYGINPNVPPEAVAQRGPLGAPTSEHSLLLIGFDQSEFVFHDPDSAVSDNGNGPGFGSLFEDSTDGRLSTAETPEQMPVDGKGKMRNGDKRYQVISLTTV